VATPPRCPPYEAIVSFAMPPNVDTVIVDGRILRRGGKFTAFDHEPIVSEAREAAVRLRDKAKWPS
jgi:cytosine/adenosine deaminase-related metal-dependent hydrolase